jgi:Holliday junction resolvase-like predicted endonuclease
MSQLISNNETERCLRACLEAEGYKLSSPRENGETGVDLIAQKGMEIHYIEVIGFKKYPPARSKDFYEIFFRAVSRIKDGAQSIVIALPERFGNGLKQRAAQYGEAWKRIGDAFPELAIWLVNCEQPFSYKRTTWNEWLT